MKTCKIFLFMLLTFSLSFAENSTEKKGVGFEVGRTFQGVDSNSTKKAKRPIDDILQEMLEVQKEQLKVQKEILAVLDNEYNPKPKKIIVDGKECIENSSADCFQMPILSDSGKRVPVLKEFVQNPSIESAKEWLRWYAKFLKTAERGGASIELAVNKYGAEAYPVNYSRYEMDTPGAYSSVLRDNNNKMVLNALGNEIEIFFFFGKNLDADTFAIDNYALFVKEIPDVKYNIVFLNQGSKKAFQALASRLKNIKEFEKGAKGLKVNPKMFEENSIYASPMAGLFLRSKKEMRSILLGRTNVEDIINKAIRTLEYEDILKDAHSVGYKKWERSGDYSKQHYKNKYDVDLNIDYLQKQYKGQ